MTLDYSRFRSLTVRQPASALHADGSVLKRQKGSDRYYVHPDGRRVTPSLHHTADTFRPGTLRSMIELQARSTEDDLRGLRLLA